MNGHCSGPEKVGRLSGWPTTVSVALSRPTGAWMMSLFLPPANPEIIPIHCRGVLGSGANWTVMSRAPADVGSQVTLGGAVAPLMAISAEVPLTMSARDDR